MKKAVRQKGFTLVEVVIAAGVTLLAGLLLVGILINNNGFFSSQSSFVSESMSLNDATSIMETHLKEAVQVVDSYPSEAPTFTTGSGTLILKLPAFNSTVLSSVYDYGVVTRDSGNNKILRLQVFPDPQSFRKTTNLVLTSLLDDINFEYLDKNNNSVSPALATKVKVSLSVLSKSGNTPRLSVIETSLRNYAP